MPSNSFTHRRTTLKRPLVCKSKSEPGCPLSHFEFLQTQSSCDLGGVVQYRVALICDEPNTEFVAQLTVTGNVTTITVPATITTGFEFDLLLEGFACPAQLIVNLTAIKLETTCKYTARVAVNVP